MINVTLPDGSGKGFESPVNALTVAASISPRLAKAALAAYIGGELSDLSRIIKNDTTLSIVTYDSEINGEYPGRRIFRHSASHILAQAVKRLFPDAKLAIGPATEDGFYYDFDVEVPFTRSDLDAIEVEMKKIVGENLAFERFELTPEEAVELFKDEPYKLELIRDLSDGAALSCYRQGMFTDLCTGPHIPSTSFVKSFALISATGAYWRGSEKNKMLTRIYGIAYPDKKDLDAHINRLEEAKRRDHNKLGRELEYFTTVDYIGQGLPIMMPKGSKVLQILQRFVEDEEERRGYLLTKTPFMAKRELYKISGHWDHYRDGMFIMGDPDGEGEVFALRPMTCPFQFQVYLSRMRSYRDLPMRFNETSSLFRNEASGEMHGLIRVRQFTLSEGHIACTSDQLEEEFKGSLDLAQFMLKSVGLDGDVSYRFSKWDKDNKEKYIGSPDEWENVQDRMKLILDGIGIKYAEADGEAAFYGPKLDIQIRNVHGKEDTLITIQIDFQLASRFGMEYVDADGQKKFPYVIHRSSIGCYERTLALLIEKYAGALPVWLAPTQVKLLTIAGEHGDFAKSYAKKLRSLGIRCEIDGRNEKIGFKIREAQLEKIPFMLIIGDKEVENNSVSVRSRRDGDMGVMTLAGFIELITAESAAPVSDYL